MTLLGHNTLHSFNVDTTYFGSGLEALTCDIADISSMVRISSTIPGRAA